MVSEGPVLWMGNIRSKGSLKSSGHWSGCEVLGVLSCDWKSEKVQGKMRWAGHLRLRSVLISRTLIDFLPLWALALRDSTIFQSAFLSLPLNQLIPMPVHLVFFPFKPFLFPHPPHLKVVVSDSTERGRGAGGLPSSGWALSVRVVLYCRVPASLSVLPGSPHGFCRTRFGSSSSELKCVFFCLTCKLGFQIFASSRLSCSCHCKLECFVLVCRLLEDVRELKLRAVLCLVTQLCPTLCDAMNCSPPGSSVHGILQARILELVVIPFSRGSSWPRDQTWVSCIAGRFFTVWGTRGIPKSEEFD